MHYLAVGLEINPKKIIKFSFFTKVIYFPNINQLFMQKLKRLLLLEKEKPHYQPLIWLKLQNILPKKKVRTKTKCLIENMKEYCIGYWLAFKDGVYDVSSFVENHPGGKQILITAGKALEACWKIFTIHQIDHVYEVLEEYRIGNLPPGI